MEHQVTDGMPFVGMTAGGVLSLATTERILLGPAHFAPVDGLALSGAAAFDTPLGRVSVDAAARTTRMVADLSQRVAAIAEDGIVTVAAIADTSPQACAAAAEAAPRAVVARDLDELLEEALRQAAGEPAANLLCCHVIKITCLHRRDKSAPRSR